MSRPTLRGFWRDAWHQLRHPIVPTLVAVVVVCAGVLTVFATTGQGMATQLGALERINSPEGRLITITDASGGAGLHPDSVAALASLDGVEWAFGVSAAVDVHNVHAPWATTVPARLIHGSLPPSITVHATREPRGGDALVTAAHLEPLHLAGPFGAIAGGRVDATVVGTFEAAAPLPGLGDTALIFANDDHSQGLLRIQLSVDDVSRIGAVREAALSSVRAADRSQLAVQDSQELANVGADVVDRLAAQARQTLLGVLAITCVLVAAVWFGRVQAIAKDIGRRRTLGASRSLIAAQVIVNAALSGTLGATLGIGLGLVVVWRLTGRVPGAAFVVAVAALVVLACAVAAVPPAIRAARLDPARILRVP